MKGMAITSNIFSRKRKNIDPGPNNHPNNLQTERVQKKTCRHFDFGRFQLKANDSFSGNFEELSTPQKAVFQAIQNGAANRSQIESTIKDPDDSRSCRWVPPVSDWIKNLDSLLHQLVEKGAITFDAVNFNDCLPDLESKGYSYCISQFNGYLMSDILHELKSMAEFEWMFQHTDSSQGSSNHLEFWATTSDSDLITYEPSGRYGEEEHKALLSFHPFKQAMDKTVKNLSAISGSDTEKIVVNFHIQKGNRQKFGGNVHRDGQHDFQIATELFFDARTLDYLPSQDSPFFLELHRSDDGSKPHEKLDYAREKWTIWNNDNRMFPFHRAGESSVVPKNTIRLLIGVFSLKAT